uniref:Uncharacterized protein n=1 Tax=Mycena chlorophos TaxID=658473 RepID=A0ABQ0LUX4_MYCCL|nr:predicted protein [Mycena chlorophos]
MFHRAKNTTITGGTFIVNNLNNNNALASEPEDDYRRIRLGDINILKLVSEVELIEDRVIRRRKRRGRENTVKVVVGRQKAYHAKIFGSPDIFTVVAYEGDLSQWHKKSSQDVTWDGAASDDILHCLMHPSFVQLFGVTNSTKVHALIYHNELVPAFLAITGAPTYLTGQLLLFRLRGQLAVIRHILNHKQADPIR